MVLLENVELQTPRKLIVHTFFLLFFILRFAVTIKSETENNFVFPHQSGLMNPRISLLSVTQSEQVCPSEKKGSSLEHTAELEHQVRKKHLTLENG